MSKEDIIIMFNETAAKTDTLKSKALIFNSIISCQTGTIVSRDIIKKPKRTVTIFAFDTGHGFSGYTAPFDALAYIMEREAGIKISRKSCRLKDGECIMPAQESHALQAVKAFKMMLVTIKV